MGHRLECKLLTFRHTERNHLTLQLVAGFQDTGGRGSSGSGRCFGWGAGKAGSEGAEIAASHTMIQSAGLASGKKLEMQSTANAKLG